MSGFSAQIKTAGKTIQRMDKQVEQLYNNVNDNLQAQTNQQMVLNNLTSQNRTVTPSTKGPAVKGDIGAKEKV